MWDLLGSLSSEYIAGGIVGLLMLGVLIRNVIGGFREAMKKYNESQKASLGPIASAMSISWDRDQIERALQALETIAENSQEQTRYMSAVSKAQGIMSDRFQTNTQDRLQDILTRLDVAEKNQRPPRKRT